MVAHDTALHASAERARISQAFFRLSQQQRRHAHEYKRWALADAAEGRLDRYERHRSWSDEFWQSAKKNLFRAKQWRDQ